MPKLTNIEKVGQVVEAQLAPDNVTVITLGNREADVYDFLLCAEQRDAKYVIRAAQDRRLENETSKLWEQLSKPKMAGRIELEVAAQENRPQRIAQAEVRFASVIIKPP